MHYKESVPPQLGVRVRVCDRNQREFTGSTTEHLGNMAWVTASSCREPDLMGHKGPAPTLLCRDTAFPSARCTPKMNETSHMTRALQDYRQCLA